MSNAASQPANGVHFLRLERLGFETKAFGVIAAVENKVRDTAFSIPYGTDTLINVIHVAVLLAIYHDATADVAGTNGFPQLAIKYRRLQAGLQNALGLACDFLP